MNKFLSVISALLLSTTWMVAQGDMNQTPSQSSPANTQTSSDTGSQTTVQGCLSGSAGSYTLTDSSGTAYQLSGNTSKLAKHVGHQVEVTGTVAASGAQSSTGGAETGTAGGGGASQQQTLQVSSFKHIASSCTPGH